MLLIPRGWAWWRIPLWVWRTRVTLVSQEWAWWWVPLRVWWPGVHELPRGGLGDEYHYGYGKPGVHELPRGGLGDEFHYGCGEPGVPDASLVHGLEKWCIGLGHHRVDEGPKINGSFFRALTRGPTVRQLYSCSLVVLSEVTKMCQSRLV